MKRTWARWLTAGSVAVLMALSVGLQAGKVTTVWVATIAGGDGQHVFGLPGFQFRPEYGGVNAFFATYGDGTPYSGFSITLANDKSPANAYIGFRDLTAVQSDVGPGRTPQCHFPSSFDPEGYPLWNTDFGYAQTWPIWDDGTWRPVNWTGYPGWIATSQTTSCIVDFLSGAPGTAGHRFPTDEWYSVKVDVRAFGINFQTMSVGDSETTQRGAMWVHVYRKGTATIPNCPLTADATYFAGVGGDLRVFDTGVEITVTRLSATQWDVQYAVPARVAEYVQPPGVAGRKGALTCPTSQLIMATTTGPIVGHSVFTKVSP